MSIIYKELHTINQLARPTVLQYFAQLQIAAHQLDTAVRIEAPGWIAHLPSLSLLQTGALTDMK